MNKKYLIICLLNVALTLPLRAQNSTIGDALLNANKLNAVIAVLVVILIGIIVFLMMLERRIKKLEK